MAEGAKKGAAREADRAKTLGKVSAAPPPKSEEEHYEELAWAAELQRLAKFNGGKAPS